MSIEEYWIEFEFSRRKFGAFTGKVCKEKRKSSKNKRKHLKKAKAKAIVMKNLSSLLKLGPNIIIILLLIATSLRCKSSPLSPPSSLNHRKQLQDLTVSLNGLQLRQANFAEPEAAENIQTVAVGRPVKFKCVVNDIGDHKVGIVA